MQSVKNKYDGVSIVLTWNSVESVEECIDSLLTSSLKTKILVIDNDSADNTRDVLNRKYPDIEVVNTGSNLGYAGGNNFGIKLAQKYDPHYVFILNPDAKVGVDCIANMQARMDAEKELAGVSPLIYFKEPENMLWFSGSEMKWRTGERLQLPTKDLGQFKTKRYTKFLSGCAMMLRMSDVTKVGLMDERYFLYCEETDWSLRFEKSGFKIGLVSDAKAWHNASLSTGGFYSPIYQYYINRNRLLLIRKHKLYLLPVVIFSSLYMNLFRLVSIYRSKGNQTAFKCFKSICKAYRDFAFFRFGNQNISR